MRHATSTWLFGQSVAISCPISDLFGSNDAVVDTIGHDSPTSHAPPLAGFFSRLGDISFTAVRRS